MGGKVYDTILKRRSIRRFQQKEIPFPILEKLINAARVAPSAANLQPCEYIVVTEKKLVDEVFSTLKWAGYIAPAGDPPPNERPTAYIVVLINTNKAKWNTADLDAGAAIENILLTAQEEGLGSCWLGSIDRDRLKQILNIPDHCKINSVIALGYPNEKPVMEEIDGNESIKYWKDSNGVLHVPKRKLVDILHKNGY